ncbi:hypothetical protein IID20_05455, partial [Patescibacteria group bacterium]|nr:hypothetical protein [Patescibacteria group bacterium]
YSFHLWPGIFLLILILAGRRVWSYPNYFLALIIFGVSFAYFILYLFTPSFEFVLDGTIVSRNFLTIIPLSIFWSGILLARQSSKDKI